jgi:hypothetical protein
MRGLSSVLSKIIDEQNIELPVSGFRYLVPMYLKPTYDRIAVVDYDNLETAVCHYHSSTGEQGRPWDS